MRPGDRNCGFSRQSAPSVAQGYPSQTSEAVPRNAPPETSGPRSVEQQGDNRADCRWGQSFVVSEPGQPSPGGQYVPGAHSEHKQRAVREVGSEVGGDPGGARVHNRALRSPRLVSHQCLPHRQVFVNQAWSACRKEDRCRPLVWSAQLEQEALLTFSAAADEGELRRARACASRHMHARSVRSECLPVRCARRTSLNAFAAVRVSKPSGIPP